eukprot:30858-Pelagococcus_subviridis.AAC.13
MSSCGDEVARDEDRVGSRGSFSRARERERCFFLCELTFVPSRSKRGSTFLTRTSPGSNCRSTISAPSSFG